MNRAIVLLLHAIGPISVPCIYLYFKALLDDKNTLKKNYRHFIIPLLLSLLFFVTFLTHHDQNHLYYSLFGTSMVFLNIFYCVNIYVFLKKHIWGVKNELKSLESHQKTIYNWTLFLFLGFSFIAARFALLLVVQRLDYDPMASPRSLWLNALVWLMIFIKLLLTPEILGSTGNLMR
jgi:fatty acid desaturase